MARSRRLLPAVAADAWDDDAWEEGLDELDDVDPGTEEFEDWNQDEGEQELLALQQRERALRAERMGGKPMELAPTQERYAENVARSQPGETRSVTATTVPQGPNNIPLPLDLARVQVDPDLAQPWVVTLNCLGATFASGGDIIPFQFSETKAQVRWGHRGVDYEVQIDWRLGQVFSITADFIDVSVLFDPGAFVGPNAPAQLTAGATIMASDGAVAPTWRPTFTGVPTTANPNNFSPGPFPIPRFAQRLEVFENFGLPVLAPTQQYFVELTNFIAGATRTTLIRGPAGPANANPPAPVLVPGWAAFFRFFNAGQGLVTYTPVWELAL